MAEICREMDMNSFERVKAAFELKEPDRVPIIELAINSEVVKKACPEAKNIVEFSELVGLDAVCHFHHFDTVKEDGTTYIDEWGVTYKKTLSDEVDHPISGPIKSLDDLVTYTPPDPSAPGRLSDLPDLISRFKGEKAIIFHHRAAFMWAVYLVGFENLLKAFVNNEELAHTVLDMVLEVNQQIVRQAIRAGADIISLGDDYAGNKGPFMSPKHFRKFIKPRLAQMVEATHKEGAYCLKHTDGNILPIIDDIIETGIDALNPIEPAAGMDIGKVKTRYGDKVCLVGNIDCTELLPNGTERDVEKAVKECIRTASPGGGHIISSSNSIHASVKPENYLAMIRAVKKYGAYPINLKN